MAAKKTPKKETLFIDAKVANCQRLNVRKAPSTDSDIITVLRTGTIVQQGSVQDGWAEIKLHNDSKIYYAMSDYIVPLIH